MTQPARDACARDRGRDCSDAFPELALLSRDARERSL